MDKKETYRKRLTVEDALKQLREQGREPTMLEYGTKDLDSISEYKESFEDVTNNIEEIANEIPEPYKRKLLREVKWLRKVCDRANGDLTNYLHRYKLEPMERPTENKIVRL